MKKLGRTVVLTTSILLGGAFISFEPLGLQTTIQAASQSVKFTKTTFQTTSNLNLRTGPSTNNKTILTIPKGKIVSSQEKKGSWYKISYTYTSKGKKMTSKGWVSGSFLKEYYKNSKLSGSYYFTTKTSYLYTTPDKKKKSVAKISMNNGFYVKQRVLNSIGETWYAVSHNGESLFVKSSDVAKKSYKSFSQVNYKATKTSYVYHSYGVTSKKLTKIPKGAILQTKEKVGDWYAVTFNGQTGYFYKGNFTKYTPPKESVVSDGKTYMTTLNVDVRQFADESATIMVTIPEGTKVIPTHVTANGWYKVEFGGVTGYLTSDSIHETTEDDLPKEDITEEALTKRTFLVTTSVNIMKTADENSTSVATIPDKTIIVPTHITSNNWYKVTFNHSTGYIRVPSVIEVRTGDPLATRDSYQFIDLRTPSPVTAAQIDNYIANYVKLTGKPSVLSGKGNLFIKAGNDYGLNALYLAAHAIHESAHGTSHLSFGKFNLFGFGAYDASPYVAAHKFETVEQNIEYIAREMKTTYLSAGNWKHKGYYLGFSTKTLNNTRIDSVSEGMNFYYASDPEWGKKIAKHMENMLPYDKAYYSKATVSNTIISKPTVPLGSDIFPDGVLATAKSDIKLRLKKGDAAKTGDPVIKKGAEFLLLEKTNDYWVRLKVDGTEYWTNDIRFDIYTTFISVKNLGRVNVDNLNIRSTPEVNSSNRIGTFSLNEYVHLVLQKDGTLKMDSSKTWFEVKLSKGTGWVSAQYITRELK